MIRAWVNQDGRSNGLTAPNGPSQQAVIRARAAERRRPPGEMSYVEAHGTGTPLGDPIETPALASRLRPGRPNPAARRLDQDQHRTHRRGAAGLAGVAKVILASEQKAFDPVQAFNFKKGAILGHRLVL